MSISKDDAAVHIVQTFKKLIPNQLTRCVCDGLATVLFTETMGSIVLERRLFCDNCNPFLIMEPIPEFPWNPNPGRFTDPKMPLVGPGGQIPT